MITKKKVEKALQKAGFDGVELWYDRAGMQWLFCEGDTLTWPTTSSLIYRLDMLTVEQWVDHARDCKEQSW